MPINYVFNGYFRSGTTLLWQILKSSNVNYKIFYEPLHPKLINNINRFGKTGRRHWLHNIDLWNEYIEQGRDFLDELKRIKSKFSGPYPLTRQELIDYLNVFHKQPQDVILQPNRLHFNLQDMMHYYNAKTFHVVRNPISVYKSIKKVYAKNNSNVIGNLRSGLFAFYNGFPRLSTSFEAKQLLDYVYCLKQNPDWWCRHNKRISILKTPFATHVLSWVLCNYYALESSDVYIFTYEELLNNPVKIKKMIEENTSLNFNIKMVDNNSKNKTDYRDPQLIEIVKKLGVHNEYEYILERINQ